MVPTTEQSFAQSDRRGTALRMSREDHTHGTPADPVASILGSLLGTGHQVLVTDNGNDTVTLSFANPTRLGSAANLTAGNYTEVEATGMLRFEGDATVFDDLPPVAITSLKPSGAGADPTRATFVGNISAYTFDINDVAEGSTEITHKYEEGTDLEIHIHWVTNGTEGTAALVNHEVEWVVANIDTGFTYAYGSSTVDTSGDITIPANTTDRSPHIADVGTIDGSALKIGAYIMFRYRRIALSGAGADPAADPFILAIGFHAKQDTVGSRQEYAK